MEAVQWYEWVKGLPQSVTRGIFLNATGYELDGMHPQFDGILLAGDDEGRSYMFKLTRPESTEAYFATRVTGMPFVVASTYQRAEQVDANGVKHLCGGLLMRKFDRSLFGHDFQCSAAVLLRRCKAMITAINALHTDNIVHMDLKEANIFVRDGLWFVGDFGSCVYHGEPVRETTEGCYVEPRNVIIGKPARWHHDWFALALVFASQLRVHGEPIDVSVQGFRERVLASISANCEMEELREMLTAMVCCDEQCMRFEWQADFTVVTDEVIVR
jgi:serine/threonine protein kinase